MRERLNQLLADYRAVDLQLQSELNALAVAEDQLTNSEAAQKIIQIVAQGVQQQAHDKIASVVSRCLETVFENAYEFKIEFERKRGRTEAVLTFVRGGLVISDPLNESGGGVIDVAAFALRLACLVLEKPQRRRVLILDEPFTKIRGKENRRRMRGLLESLARDFNVQMILNIDGDSYPEFLLGKVIEVG